MFRPAETGVYLSHVVIRGPVLSNVRSTFSEPTMLCHYNLVRPGGHDPPSFGLKGRCSAFLNYRRVSGTPDWPRSSIFPVKSRKLCPLELRKHNYGAECRIRTYGGVLPHRLTKPVPSPARVNPAKFFFLRFKRLRRPVVFVATCGTRGENRTRKPEGTGP